MDKLKLLLILVSCALVIACGYILIEKVELCEATKNESYALGFQQGVEQWNTQVIYNVNNNGKIPYWFNGSYYELSFTQICGGQND